jgi:membrane associated rhomboid family serine protease
MICNSSPKNFKQAPITSSIGFILIVMFILYSTIIKSRPCGTDIISIFLSNFVTLDVGQLILNLFTLYSLAVLEVNMGSDNFLKLLTISIVFNTLLEWSVHKKFKDLPCSLGFTGIIVTLIVFKLMVSKIVSVNIMTVLVFVTLSFTLQKKENKYVSHVVGVLTGWLLGIYYLKL